MRVAGLRLGKWALHETLGGIGIVIAEHRQVEEVAGEMRLVAWC
jgi:hypothetical protein